MIHDCSIGSGVFKSRGDLVAWTMKTKGMDDLIRQMEKVGEKAAGAAAQGLFKGAGVVADSVSAAVNGIATEPFKYATNGNKRKPSPEEKAIVASAPHGIAKFRNDGLRIQTSIGFNHSGYAAITWSHARNNVRTKYKVKNGKAVRASIASGGTSSKPVAAIANAINSGTSFMVRQPFLRKAFSQSAGSAQGAMEAKIKEELDKISFD